MEACCACGTVRIGVTGAPIMTVECGCSSCQTAGARFGDVLSDHRTTRYTMVRKDRVALLTGAGSLQAHRLTPDSATRRVTATCCGAPMYLDFEKGHWLSVYSARLPEGAAGPLLCRTMTMDLPPEIALPDDVPNPKRHTVGFVARLLGAWVAMGFRSPALDWAQEG